MVVVVVIMNLITDGPLYLHPMHIELLLVDRAVVYLLLILSLLLLFLLMLLFGTVHR